MVPRMIGRIFAVALLALVLFAPSANAQSQQADVVVELYTSQGCGQCPRGNRLLGMLVREERTLALTFPVGIWDYLGWRDTFAQPDFTERQRQYSRALRVRGRFTPQLIINGTNQMSASYWDEARSAFDQAAAQPLRRMTITISRLRSNRVRIGLSGGAAHPGADVWFVPYDPGPVDVYVTRGPNKYRRVLHYNLAASIARLGGWTGSAVYFEAARCTPHCAVIVQEPNGGAVLAAAFTTTEP